MSQGATSIPDDPPPLIGVPWRMIRKFDRFRFRHWFAQGEYTNDWTSVHITTWRRVLGGMRERSVKILEIGSWEGRSAVFFLNFFPSSTIACIDTFQGAEEHKNFAPFATQLPKIERRFEQNLAQFKDRVEKIKSDSAPALQRLRTEGRQFDLAYIDGSHRRDDVMADSLNVWPLVAPGGVVIWDDYTWAPHFPPEERPQPAIDEFLKNHEGRYRLLAKGFQVIVRKLS